MLRLSIIVPFRHDHARLEATLLSVLENRPDGSELIVVHDGSYNDPYSLDDELTLLAADRKSSLTSMLNQACDSARSHNVCYLLDGVQVNPGWADEPLRALDEDGADAVAVELRRGGQRSYGISRGALRRAESLRAGAVEGADKGKCAGPSLACAFFNRDSFLALDGWNEELDPAMADVEMALRLLAAGWDVHCSTESSVATAERRPITPATCRDAARLAHCYGLASPGAMASASELVRGCLTGKLGQSLAWLSGLKGATTSRLRERKQSAEELKDDADIVVGARLFNPDQSQQLRRAA